MSSIDGTKEVPPRNKLDILLDFMEKEVQIQRRIDLAKNFAATPQAKEEREKKPKQRMQIFQRKEVTEANFHAGDFRECLFCGRDNHHTRGCFRAKHLQYEEKKEALRKNGACYKCFDKHLVKNCSAKSSCKECGGGHHIFICPKLKPARENTSGKRKSNWKSNPNNEVMQKRNKTEERHEATELGMANVQCSVGVFLQTLKVTITSNGSSRIVRAFLDSGSQRSYILKTTAEEMELKKKSEEIVIHSLFGGRKTNQVLHCKYDINIQSMNGKFQIEAEVRDQFQICDNLSRMTTQDYEAMIELRKLNIQLSDVGNGSPPIELLIGADLYGRLLTGCVKHLKCGPTAVETSLGWTLLGLNPSDIEQESAAISYIANAATDADLAKLWELEVIGIKDPMEVTPANQIQQQVKNELITNIMRGENGRYAVFLPRREGIPLLPSNRDIAYQRLLTTTRKLKAANMFDNYSNLFHEWEEEGFIEKVKSGNTSGKIHYLPHRAVLKPDSITTPVRPVFDASAKVKGSPSLNDCLHKGTNHILLIPDVLVRFRERRVAFTSDIRKAFQMIGIADDDRDLLRFLWWKNTDTTVVTEYRHARVPFGATSSPFILGAVLEHHLVNQPEPFQGVAKKLLEFLYVDNCLGSVDTEEEYKVFRQSSIDMLKGACMDLRLWQSNLENDDVLVSVLGLKWCRKTDLLHADVSKVKAPTRVTKRTVLSTVQQVFDPIGFTCPATIPMKLLLQRAWIEKRKWDDDLPEEQVKMFYKWCQQLQFFHQIQIPRLMTGGCSTRSNWTLHTFTDSSKFIYAAVIYLRIKTEQYTSVQLIAAKSRLAPLKGTTIPRLELLGCLLGARLFHNVEKALNLYDVRRFLWTDSTTADAWIKQNANWGTFIGSRTAEINKLTKSSDWRYIPGKMNPADLPSRGCTIKELQLSKWWEGPTWLYEKEHTWPNGSGVVNEEEIAQERSKQVTVSCPSVILSLRYQRTFDQMIRIMAWTRRFIFNATIKAQQRRSRSNSCISSQTLRSGVLTEEELEIGETSLVLSIQQEAFGEERLDQLKSLKLRKDKQEILRVETRLAYRDDVENFKFPAVLPGNHPAVVQLITDTHRKFAHAGAGFLVSYLREKFWILHTRQSVKRVIKRCYRCRRYSSKATVTEMPGLPQDRVRDAEPFETTGIDLAGPVVLKNTKKIWMVLYTCAVYRAVHLDVVDCVSTKAFIKSLERFIKKFRRPVTIYSDNGTNFHGAVNLMRKVDWTTIGQQTELKPIIWKFIPSTAAWHGGWWERLIRSTKDLIRRTLGNKRVTRKEFEKILGTVEDVINERPLTYQSEDPEDLSALTPQMFLRPLGSNKFPEMEQIDGSHLRLRWKYVAQLQTELKGRWRKEYLALLLARKQKLTRALKVGELVVVGDDGKKRSDWPIARIVELFSGKGGVSRVAKVKTADGVYIRPVQRLYPLELDLEEEKVVKTKFGRVVRPPTLA